MAQSGYLATVFLGGEEVARDTSGDGIGASLAVGRGFPACPGARRYGVAPSLA